MVVRGAQEKLCLVEAMRDVAREHASLGDVNATEAERCFKASLMRKKAHSTGLEKNATRKKLNNVNKAT